MQFNGERKMDDAWREEHLSYTQELIVRTQCHLGRVKPEKHIVHVSGTKKPSPRGSARSIGWGRLITGVQGEGRQHAAPITIRAVPKWPWDLKTGNSPLPQVAR